MNPIFQALNSGYTPEEIIKFISKAIPQIAPSINKAKSQGYPVQQILGFLSKRFNSEDRSGMSESERHASNRRSDSEMAKHGLKVAGTALATPLIASAAQSALSRALPSSVQGLVGQMSSNIPGANNPNVPTTPGATSPLNTGSAPNQPMPQQGIQQQTSQPQQPPVQNVPSSIAQPPQSVQPQGIPTPEETALKNIEQRKAESEKLFELAKQPRMSKEHLTPFMKVARQLVKKGDIKDADTFDEFRKYWEATEGKHRGSSFVEFEKYRSSLGKNQESPIENAPVEQVQPSLPEETTPEIKKADVVSTPIGVGEVKEIRNGQAIVEVDGKKHKVSEDELIQSPLSKKDLAELYDDLIQGIEAETGQEVSKNVNWAGYDPNTNELAYRPHDGALYIYDDISPQDAKALTEVLTLRKTSGGNFIGPWVEGTKSPIGAAMSKLIKRLQSERGGKGNEYIGKYQTLYDATEPAVKAAKKKHAEERKKQSKKPTIS